MKFKHIRFKNFLSFGNQWTDFELDTNETILIFGGNGSGKSSLLESVFFAFTGKSYRNVSKPKLINNINKKNLLVELTIEHMGATFLIRRGLNPALFEIFRDGDLLDEDSSIKDYQRQLETILGIDAKTFKQTIMMSSRYYTPFLDLRPQDKRDFIENMFSLKLFSDMNEYLKRKLQTTKLNVKGLTKDIERVNSNIKVLNDVNEKQLKQNKVLKEDILKEIKDMEIQISLTSKNIDSKNNKIEELNTKLKKLNKEIADKGDISKEIDLLEYRITKHVQKIKFFTDNTICKTCSQDIDINFRNSKIKEEEDFKQQKEADASTLKESLNEIMKINNKVIDINSASTKLTQQIMVLHSKITGYSKNIEDKKTSINGLDNVTIVNQSDFDKLKSSLEGFEKQKRQLQQFQKYVGITIELISEKGIKKFIIAKYVPILNTLLNQYLKRFEAPYSVMFNESLEESIIARGYEDLGYSNLSSGEKQRLDTSLVFSFLELCRLKNSIDTNVIFFDEILDQSLDQIGINGILRIFEELKQQGYSVFVVSHRPGAEESFDKMIKVTKKKFTEIEVL